MIVISSIFYSTGNWDTFNTYKVFGIDCPASIPLTNGVLQYVHPKSDTLPSERKKRSRKPKKQRELHNSDTVTTQEQLKQPKCQTSANDSGKNAETTTTEIRKRGRPKGSKNRKTLEREAEILTQNIELVPKRKPGRPKGSKNKR